MLTVTVCTDEVAVGYGFRQIATASGLQAECLIGSSAEVLATLQERQPELILIDWNSFASFELISETRARAPFSRVILWARVISPEMASQALSLGVRGLLRKTLAEGAMLEAIRRVAAGELWIEPELSAGLLDAKRITLSPRERELVHLLSQGLRNKEIATEMGLSEGTVKIYVSRLLQKTDLKDRLELALYGLRNTIVGGVAAKSREDLPVMQSLHQRPPEIRRAEPCFATA